MYRKLLQTSALLGLVLAAPLACFAPPPMEDGSGLKQSTVAGTTFISAPDYNKLQAALKPSMRKESCSCVNTDGEDGEDSSEIKITTWNEEVGPWRVSAQVLGPYHVSDLPECPPSAVALCVESYSTPPTLKCTWSGLMPYTQVDAWRQEEGSWKADMSQGGFVKQITLDWQNL